jgi:hypothetical protein
MALVARGGPLRAISFRLIAHPGHSRKSKGIGTPKPCRTVANQVAIGLPERGFLDAKRDGIATTLQIIEVAI